VIDGLDPGGSVLVGWSYGGLVVSDSLATRGTDDLAGVVIVGGASGIGTDDASGYLADAFVDLFPELLSTDAAESVASLDTFVRPCVHGDPSTHERYLLLGSNVVVPAYVRAGLLEREAEHHEALADLDVPALLAHGEQDRVVRPETTEDHAELISDVEVSWYPDVGHSSFREAPERFNRELRAFTDRC
jgi:pimeloyl-ACP methyl ester carboxylesterase